MGSNAAGQNIRLDIAQTDFLETDSSSKFRNVKSKLNNNKINAK